MQVGLLLYIVTCVMTMGLASTIILPLHFYRYHCVVQYQSSSYSVYVYSIVTAVLCDLTVKASADIHHRNPKTC